MIGSFVAAIINQNDLGTLPRNDFTQGSINGALEIVFLVAGGVAVLIVTIAGLFFVLSRGNPQATAKARNTILYALIGLAVSIFAYTLVRFVLNQL